MKRCPLDPGVHDLSALVALLLTSGLFTGPFIAATDSGHSHAETTPPHSISGLPVSPHPPPQPATAVIHTLSTPLLRNRVSPVRPLHRLFRSNLTRAPPTILSRYFPGHRERRWNRQPGRSAGSDDSALQEEKPYGSQAPRALHRHWH